MNFVTNRVYKSLAYALILLLLGGALAGSVVYGAESQTLTVTAPARESTYTFTQEITAAEGSDYAGLEFGVKLSSETALAVEFSWADEVISVAGAETATANKDGVYHYGIFANDNVFSGGKVGTLQFIYTGSSTQTIELVDVQVLAINTDNELTKVSDSLVEEGLVITVKKGTSSSGGSGSRNTVTTGEKENTTTSDNNDDNVASDLTSGSATSQHFSDVTAGYSWAASQIDYLYEAGIVSGTGNGSYSPGSNIIRGDFILMLANAFDFQGTGAEHFADVPADSYYHDAIAAARALGIASGDGENFRPQENITRQDMMVLIARTLEVQGEALPAGDSADLAAFADNGQISTYAQPSVAALVKSGIVNGDGTGINPLSPTTRAEVAVVLYQILAQN